MALTAGRHTGIRIATDAGRPVYAAKCHDNVVGKHIGALLGTDAGKAVYGFSRCAGSGMRTGKHVGVRIAGSDAGRPVYAVSCCQTVTSSECGSCPATSFLIDCSVITVGCIGLVDCSSICDQVCDNIEDNLPSGISWLSDFFTACDTAGADSARWGVTCVAPDVWTVELVIALSLIKRWSVIGFQCQDGIAHTNFLVTRDDMVASCLVTLHSITPVF